MLLELIDMLGINALFRFLNRKRPLILYYHGICEDDFTLLRGYDVRQLPRSVFRRQVEHLRAKGYRFVSMDELLAALDSGETGGRLINLSFDDGLRNVVRNAYPIMKEQGAKGIFYLVADLIGGDGLLWTDFVETVVRSAPAGDFRFTCRDETFDYPLSDESSRRIAMKDIKRRLRGLSDRERVEHLEQFAGRALKDVPAEFTLASWEELRDLDPGVLELGSHTRTHPNLTQLESDEEFEDELAGSARAIEGQVGYRIRHLCYPAGAYDERALAKVAEHGYRSAVSSDDGFADASPDAYRLKRVEAEVDWPLFLATSSGAYAFLYGFKARLRRLLGGR